MGAWDLERKRQKTGENHDIKLGSKCTDSLLVWDNLGRNGKYIWNVISLWLVGTCRSHVQGTLQMSFTCVWWLHHRQSVLVPTMFLRCSHLFPGVLAPSVMNSQPSRQTHFSLCFPFSVSGINLSFFSNSHSNEQEPTGLPGLWITGRTTRHYDYRLDLHLAQPPLLCQGLA